MQPTYPQDHAVTEDQATPPRPRPKPGERRVMILQALAAMLEAPKSEKITTAALAARLDVSEAALYRHFSSKAKMYEGLIEFIETTFFGLVNQIAAKEPDGVLQARAIALMLLNFAAKNPGMTRVLTGEALVGEDERLAERVEQMLERVEASIRQSLRLARVDAGAGNEASATGTAALPADYDPSIRASLVVSYVLGRWHRYAKSGFAKPPTEHADAQLRLILQ
ncbi:nucleoid occlusion factor SlmA [Burkholderia dolosa]|uniref:Nucleoid occlusion factor SlmA n=1 Tax=Burkholderia dolosa TaxID=152500 RepID=A0A892IC11_9BURK|nr:MULTISPECIES: nucleoid occlusion factor SlmA [Burkholderia]AKE02409.1 dihydroorotate oxidase [Burkholderia cepacia]AYZ97156.1 nucleoid occlusion factor SlmA [Burkholderia dolosa]EAY67615.1 Transcriptional regulator [Burkholderia dolosa AU0158]ETP64195.1 dihydroorotate oxidase [Burkholderia dolosa PC543]MBR8420474.1 nucleoid occlusion factor SlmA [Burkholderia dolosa]